MGDLLDGIEAGRNPGARAAEGSYTADDIEVLEGLEPVRRRPGMYVGGTDERALHHLVAELLDNAMDEAVAGHATRIELELGPGERVTVRDNGRGIPVEPHPKFLDKSALEVILTTLHSGGKFSGKAYATAGGLHGVGVSVVNALAEELEVEVARNRELYRQRYRRGRPLGPVERVGAAPNRRGTVVSFTPDRTIFPPSVRFRPAVLHRMARSKAYLFRGVEIRWRCDPGLLVPGEGVPAEEVFHFPKGLGDFLESLLAGRERVVDEPFAGEAELEGGGRVEWAVAWPADEEAYAGWYCNTVPTPLGGTHEAGLRAALVKGLKAHAERAGLKKAQLLTAEDVVGGAAVLLSLFVREPQFQGQTKERLVSPEAARLVEAALKDRFELWLADHPAAANRLLDVLIARAEERLARRKAKEEVGRKTATRKLRLPGKLADCAREGREGTELFIVEGDSAGGSAKQARDRETQAVLPLRGKILNVAAATADKLASNKELQDLVTALGCGTGPQLRLDDLRYERIIVMTDADVDGAHIAALLLTFFFREMRPLLEHGHVFLAQPPLYRLSAGGQVAYARDERDRDRLLATLFKGKRQVEIGRFKGLGEMNPAQLRETTMDPARRQLLRVRLEDVEGRSPADLVERLMGRRPELRLAYIQEHALQATALDV
ncbi:MAG: DNA topoisomerase 4 subunit B [Geminicoccaceae bacterium]|nr:MAG: DNA topoisomerase 4 subunit B [Geminicoccaceae bacterium]